MLTNDSVSMSVVHLDHFSLFTTRWSTWPGNHLVQCVAELVGSCISIHARM